MSGSAWDCDKGYVAFLKTTYPLSPSGLMDGTMGMISMLPSPVCGVSPVSGRFPEEESPEPLTGLKVSHPSSGRVRVGRRRWGDVCHSPSGSPWSVGGDRENRVLGVCRGSGSRVVTVGIRAWRSQARQLVEQQDESEMPAQGQVQEEVSEDESVAQPQGAQAAAAAATEAAVAVLQSYVPGSVAARAGSSRCPVSGAPSGSTGEAAGRARGGAARASAAMGTGSTRAGRRRTAVTEDRTALLERFLRLRPPMFHGEYDPDKAESWTHELERIFETMECAEEDQVRLAVYQLKGAAHEWWRVQRQMHFQGQRLDHITWQRFSEVFHGEYFPDYARRERRDQFHALVQDDLTVSQYHQRGYVAFLKTTYPLSPSGLMDGAMGYVAFLKMTWPMSPSHRVTPDAWVATGGVSPSRAQGDTSDISYVAFLKATGPMSPSQSLADSGAEGKTVVRTVACESLAGLSWLIWDAEDSLEFYPAQASRSFFSLPRSLWPRNCLERSGESSQQRQGARRAEETGR
ncbi:hypothetical protein Taro_050301 [Colocasia esculenta]|uniref:Retrotransposon gag domain-containing protein n=1 Tax=Colocasia esculenta TaxID=4460 RepID=A0A843XDG6_COLES|nr:hypothetical protein [Colocasia esculenta]